MINKITQILALLALFWTSAPFAQTTFSRITTGDVATGIGARSASWGDYDNDGHIDLFIVAHSAGNNNLLYHNNGDGTFTAITEGAIVTDSLGTPTSGPWGDYDNDGDLDLFVTTISHDRGHVLYQNNGNGTFDPATSGLLITPGTIFDSCWGDYDNDGYLDLYVLHAANPGGDNTLFHNDGDLEGLGQVTFSRITHGNIVTDEAWSLECSWIDYDNDGDLDLLVLNSGSLDFENFFYQNKGDGSFTRNMDDVPSNNGGVPRSSWGDYDNDGYMDLFMGFFGRSSLLYHNDGGSSFTRIATGPLTTDEVYSGNWGDYDNDGDLDLLAMHDEDLLVIGDEEMFIYQNDGISDETGEVTFTKIGSDSIFEGIDAVPGPWGDYDNDGDLDIFTFGEGDPLTGRRNAFYRNNGNGNNWINIKCIGTVSNRSAIGSKVKVKAVIDGKPVWQLREISGHNGNSLKCSIRFGRRSYYRFP